MAETAAPTLVLLPGSGVAASGGGPIKIRDLPGQQARVDRAERFRINARWGDLGAQTLTSVLNRAEQGDTADWADLCQFIVYSDDHIGGLYDTRIARVAQADFVIGPNPYGDPKLAAQTSELVNQLMLRIENWNRARRSILAGIFYPYSVNEMVWAYDDRKPTPASTGTNYVERIDHKHAHRYRYDEQWQLRLYDSGGKRSKGSLYGQALDPRLNIVHMELGRGGYPGMAGVLRGIAWRWWFRRMCDKLWATGLERHGAPMIWTNVQGGTPRATRNQILEQLKDMISESVGVIEDPGEIHALTEAVVSFDGYERYMAYTDGKLTANILGASDVTEPGANGARAATETRVSTAVDPRMVVDGTGFMDTLHDSLWKQMVYLNAHKWPGVPVEQLPIPVGRMKTADDEVKTDPSDKAAEIGAELDSNKPVTEPGGKPLELLPEDDGDDPEPPPPPPKGGKAPSGPSAGAKDLLEIMKSLTAKQIEPEAAVDLLLLGGVEHERACRMCGVQFGNGGPPDPKATAPVAPGRTARKATPATSGRSRSPFVLGLRSGSGAPERSSSNPSQMPLKL